MLINIHLYMLTLSLTIENHCLILMSPVLVSDSVAGAGNDPIIYILLWGLMVASCVNALVSSCPSVSHTAGLLNH